jgi:hypothetical protein
MDIAVRKKPQDPVGRARGPNSDNLAAAAEAPAEAKPAVDAVLAGWAHTHAKAVEGHH